jgi:F0F1-type ATP synthase epsilon subunit
LVSTTTVQVVTVTQVVVDHVCCGVEGTIGVLPHHHPPLLGAISTGGGVILFVIPITDILSPPWLRT